VPKKIKKNKKKLSVHYGFGMKKIPEFSGISLDFLNLND